MGAIFGGGAPSPPPPPAPPAPIADSSAADAARRAELAAQTRRRGRNATILTSGLGDTTETAVEKKTLLGTP